MEMTKARLGKGFKNRVDNVSRIQFKNKQKKAILIKAAGKKDGEEYLTSKSNVINVYEDFSRLECQPKPN